MQISSSKKKFVNPSMLQAKKVQFRRPMAKTKTEESPDPQNHLSLSSKAQELLAQPRNSKLPASPSSPKSVESDIASRIRAKIGRENSSDESVAMPPMEHIDFLYETATNAGGMASAGALTQLLSLGSKELSSNGEVRADVLEVLESALEFADETNMLDEQTIARYDELFFPHEPEGDANNATSNGPF